MGKTRKVGTTGRFGVRYGRKIRLRVKAIEEKQKHKQSCPFCGFVQVKRRAKGIYACKKCGAEFAGGAYTAATLTGTLIRKMVKQKRFAPYAEELINATETAKGIRAEAAVPSQAAEPEPATEPEPKEGPETAPEAEPGPEPAEKPKRGKPKKERELKGRKSGKEKGQKDRPKKPAKAKPVKKAVERPKKGGKDETGIGAKLRGLLKKK